MHLDPGSTEAREGLVSVSHRAEHELRIGQDNDLLSYSAGFHDEWMSLVSHWTSHWTTSMAGDSYQRSGVEAADAQGPGFGKGAIASGKNVYLTLGTPRFMKEAPQAQFPT